MEVARPCHLLWGIIPARQFVDLCLQELALHGWDIRSSLKATVLLSPDSLSAMMEIISTSLQSGFLKWAFPPGERLSVPVRYSFLVTGSVPSRSDILVDGVTARLTEAGDAPAMVPLQYDAETYVLLMYGRLNPEAAMATCRLVVASDQQAVLAFTQWFKGI